MIGSCSREQAGLGGEAGFGDAPCSPGCGRLPGALAWAGTFRVHSSRTRAQTHAFARPLPPQGGGGDDGARLAESRRGPPGCAREAPARRLPQRLLRPHDADSFLRQPGLGAVGGAERGRPGSAFKALTGRQGRQRSSENTAQAPLCGSPRFASWLPSDGGRRSPAPAAGAPSGRRGRRLAAGRVRGLGRPRTVPSVQLAPATFAQEGGALFK